MRGLDGVDELTVVLGQLRRLLEQLAVDREGDRRPLADVEALLDVQAHHPARRRLGHHDHRELLHAELGPGLEPVLPVDDHVLPVALDRDERRQEPEPLHRRGQRLQVRGPGLALVPDHLDLGRLHDGDRDRLPLDRVLELQPAGHDAVTASTCQSPGTPLSSWRPRSVNSMPEPSGEIPHGRRHQHLAGSGEGADPGTEVHGDAGDVVAAQLALTGVQAGADLEAEAVAPPSPIASRTADGARRSVEHREEPVAGRFHRTATRRVISRRAMWSCRSSSARHCAVAERATRCSVELDDVGEQHGREHPVGFDLAGARRSGTPRGSARRPRSPDGRSARRRAARRSARPAMCSARYRPRPTGTTGSPV